MNRAVECFALIVFVLGVAVIGYLMVGGIISETADRLGDHDTAIHRLSPQ